MASPSVLISPPQWFDFLEVMEKKTTNPYLAHHYSNKISHRDVLIILKYRRFFERYYGVPTSEDGVIYMGTTEPDGKPAVVIVVKDAREIDQVFNLPKGYSYRVLDRGVRFQATLIDAYDEENEEEKDRLTIVVAGGIVESVHNLPEGWDYTVRKSTTEPDVICTGTVAGTKRPRDDTDTVGGGSSSVSVPVEVSEVPKEPISKQPRTVLADLLKKIKGSFNLTKKDFTLQNKLIKKRKNIKIFIYDGLNGVIIFI